MQQNKTLLREAFSNQADFISSTLVDLLEKANGDDLFDIYFGRPFLMIRIPTQRATFLDNFVSSAICNKLEKDDL